MSDIHKIESRCELTYLEIKFAGLLSRVIYYDPFNVHIIPCDKKIG
jgi:hypothetical protein